MEDRLMLVALSVMRSGVVREFLRVRETVSAGEFYESIPLYERCRVAGHIAEEYSGSPVEVAEQILERAQQRFVRVLSLGDPSYPAMLAEIPGPPLALYCLGNVPFAEMVSIVGTREASVEARAAAHRLAADFSSCGLTVVSGMARGIDRSAHLGALDSGGATVGVLAHGIDRRYPASNEDLFALIESSSLSSLVSEYPPGVRAGQWTFALRNRIISGLSRAVVVVQAGVKSGAMITARYAAEQGRDLYAVGGFPYDPSFDGCRSLLRDGGMIIGSAADLGQMSLFPSVSPGRDPDLPPGSIHPPAAGLSPEEEKIIALVDGNGIDIDVIIRTSGLKPFVVATAVVSLEVAGLVSRSGSTVYLKR
jgi:DNA processing protein